MRRTIITIGGVASGMLTATLLGTGLAAAQETEEVLSDLATAIDTAWLLIAATLVIFMQAGFGLVEAGFVRSKNVVNILMKNTLDVSFGSLAYWAVGWGLAYGVSDSSTDFFGWGNFFLSDFEDYPSFFFQFAFAATAATIVSGAVAERTKFGAYIVYSIVITAVIYPIASHWVWDGGGWLSAFREDPISGIGMIDFAGSTVVHSVGGWAALMGAIVVGARSGKYGPNGEVYAIPGHNVAIGFLGVIILWVGWYGFNPGSTLGLTGGLAADAARVAVTTTLAAGAGGTAATLVSWMRTGKPDLSLALNGILGGLVGITAGTATVEPWAAVVIGLVAGVIIVFGVALLDALRIDDPVGAVPVHLMNGVWGTLAVGLFSSEELVSTVYGVDGLGGILTGGGADILMVNALGVVAVGAWTVVTTGILFLVIKMTIGMRVSAAEEETGLDVGEHAMEAYPEFTGARDPFGRHTGAAMSGSPDA